jgi:alpha-D-ribose 1-methylphosphonate 5-triphosphate synthase subunit PhnG
MGTRGRNGSGTPRPAGVWSDRDRRCEILAAARPEALHDLAEAVLTEAGEAIRVVAGPRVGTLMLRLREPVRGEVFNAGEVLVTEATVALAEHRGYAMRLGRAPETVLAAAILDAALAAGHPLADRVATLLDDQAAIIDAAERATWQIVAPTRVAFEEML